MNQNRRARRSNVLLTATVEVGGVATSVRLRNLSQEGALIEAEELPIEGSSTVFVRNELRVKSRVAWVHGRFAGIAFGRNLEPHEVLRHIPQPRPKAQLDFRRPGLACRELTPHERKLVERWMTSVSVPKLGE